MRFAYADPPYPGQANRYPEKSEVSYPDLIQMLCADFDGWAFSCNSRDLVDLLPICPPRARVMAWCKSFAPLLPSVRLTKAWEPVVISPVRRGRVKSEAPVFDWVVEPPVRVRQFDGQKPERFSYWLFAAAGLKRGDEFVDLFPGSGAVGRAWVKYCGQLSLPLKDAI